MCKNMDNLNIGGVPLKSHAVLAPMAGVSDRAYRELCVRFGAAYCVSEMVSSKALSFNSKKSEELMEISDLERPCGIQIFGDDPKCMADAAKHALENKPDIRKGWDDDSVNAVEVAKICESAGAAAITVHGRTRQQYYKPPVDYDIIKAVRESVSVPVIANGDIDSAERAKEVMDITGCDLVMIGRATLGNPWIFSQINAYLENPNVKIHTPDLEERLGVMIEHIGKMVEYKGEHMAMLQARKLVVGYFKGMKGAAALRNEAGKIKTLDDLYELRQKALSLQ